MKKKLIQVIKIVFFLLVIYFLGSYFLDNWEKIKEIDWNIDAFSLTVSFLLYFAYIVTLASLWHFITKLNQCSIRHFDAVIAYLYSIPGKYIPGKVFMLAARCPAYEKEGKPLRKITVCFLLENACTLLGAAFLFLISLFFFPNDLLENYKYLTVLLIIAFFICINPKIINFFLGIIGKIAKKDMLIPVTYPDMLKTVLLFIANWLVAGSGFYMLVHAVYPVPASQWLYIGGIYGLSTIIGILALFAPSGLGVREGILTAGLCLIMPEEYALTISLISRLWQTVAEIILVSGAFLVNQAVKLSHKHGQNIENNTQE
ncbi:MAG: flippase-like domain-containing protein [Oscillospiraceae bacterium]|nr:flippase-like domain-containing protein [Oscillospiraceae bacterium]